MGDAEVRPGVVGADLCVRPVAHRRIPHWERRLENRDSVDYSRADTQVRPYDGDMMANGE